MDGLGIIIGGVILSIMLFIIFYIGIDWYINRSGKQDVKVVIVLSGSVPLNEESAQEQRLKRNTLDG